MRLTIASIVLALAACGSKAPAPAAPAGDEPAADEPAESTGVTDENGNPVEVPEGGFGVTECDQYCADGCPEVEDYAGCMSDCGCAADGE